MGIPAGNESRGHRFHPAARCRSRRPVTISATLEKEGYVIADF